MSDKPKCELKLREVQLVVINSTHHATQHMQDAKKALRSDYASLAITSLEKAKKEIETAIQTINEGY